MTIGTAIQRITSAFRASPENPSTSLSNPATWLVDWMGGTPSDAGIRVNEESALRMSAVYACVRVLAESIASLPLHVYRRLDRGKELAVDHPVYRLLHDTPNPWQTSYTWREVSQTHVELWGNAYSWITRGPGSMGRPSELTPLLPGQTRAVRAGGRYAYVTRTADGVEQILDPDDVVHVAGLGWDGLMGLSPIGLAKQNIGLGLAAEKFGAKFFGNGTAMSGVLTHPGQLSDAAAKHIADSWSGTYGGIDNAHKLALLEEGMQYERIGIPPEEAQFVETRKFQISEIARIYRVPPHMIGDLDRSTNNNIEQQSIDFVTHTLRPRLVRIEQELNRKLFPSSERGTYFVEFQIAGLLRGDTASRGAWYRERFMTGSLSPNDIRELENENPIEGGDRYFVPLNMVPADAAGESETPPAEENAAPAPPEQRDAAATEQRSLTERMRAQRAHERLLVQAADKVVRREVERIGRAARRLLAAGDVRAFSEFLDEFYEDLQSMIVRQFSPVLMALAESIQASAAEEVGAAVGLTAEHERFVTDYAAGFALRYAVEGRKQIQALARDEVEPLPAIEERLERWSETKAEKTGARERVQAGAALAKAAYIVAGVTLLRWVTVGETCPICRAMDGRVVSVRENFAAEGETIAPDSPHPLTTRRAVGHPPIHQGCDCQIVAERA